MKAFFSKKILWILPLAIVILFAVGFLYHGRISTNQAQPAIFPKIIFEGEVKVGDGAFLPYQPEEHIPATQGDVTLRGQFLLCDPDTDEVLGKPEQGTVLAFYLNHLGGEISEDGGEPVLFDAELSVAGEDMCGVMVIGYLWQGGEVATVVLRNPHRFGNENAVDEFFSQLRVYGGSSFEKEMENQGLPQRSLGIVLVLFALLLLGISLFSLLFRVKISRELWLVGLSVLFAGIYFVFTSKGIMFWSRIIKFNTRALGCSMMIYLLFAMALVISAWKGRRKNVGYGILLLSAVFDLFCMILPMVSSMKFYDTWMPWAGVHVLFCLVLMGFQIHGLMVNRERKTRFLYAMGMLPILAFLLDVAATVFGWWQGGLSSGVFFAVLLVIALVFLFRVIPQNINASMKAQELEAELAESRIATMISQIQPHFIYNTLGTIEQLCITNPGEASKLVHNFTLYLRGNFSELTNTKPIRFSQEMNHVKHYTDIEQVRFPDMTIQYDLRSVDFVLPALSVQPLVENAIKHGLMGLEEGGIVTVSAFETDTHYLVEVKDDGVGFDSQAGYDDTKHVGIKNIRGRIEAMCGGTLTVESQIGKGTVATIQIPKEGVRRDSNHSR